MNKRYISLVLLLAVVLSFAGCTPAPENPEDHEDPEVPEVERSTVTMGVSWNGDPQLHPYLRWPASGDNPALGVLYPTVASIDGRGAVHPHLASGLSISGGRRLSIDLSGDLQWSDGEPLVPEDLVLALEVLLHPDFGGSDPGARLDFIEGASEFRSGEADRISGVGISQDELIIELEFDTPGISWVLSRLTPLPHHVLGGLDLDEVETALLSGDLPVLGDYELEEIREEEGRRSWILGRIIVTEEETPQDSGDEVESGEPGEVTEESEVILPAPEVLEFIFVSDLDVVNPASFDVYYSPPTGSGPTDLSGSGWEIIHRVPANAVEYLGFNTANEFLADPEVRRALAHGVDREGTVEDLFGDSGRAVEGLPAAFFGNSDISDGVTHDPARARNMLSEAGYGEDGERIPELYLLIPGGDPRRERAAERIVGDLEDIGVTLHVIPADRDLFLYTIFGRGRYDMYLLARPVEELSCPAAWAGDNSWSHAPFEHPGNSGYSTRFGDDGGPDDWAWMDEIARELPLLPLGYPEGYLFGPGPIPDLEVGIAPALGNIPEWIGFFLEGN